MKKRLAYVVWMSALLMCLLAGCGGNKAKENADSENVYLSVRESYLTSEECKNFFLVEEDGITYEEVSYECSDGSVIKGWQGTMEAVAQRTVDESQVIKLAESALLKYMDNGSENVVEYECEVKDDNENVIADVVVRYGDYERRHIVQFLDQETTENNGYKEIEDSLASDVEYDSDEVRYFFDCISDEDASFQDRETGDTFEGTWFAGEAVILSNTDKNELRDLLAKKGADFLTDRSDEEDEMKGVIIETVLSDGSKFKMVVFKDKKYTAYEVDDSSDGEMDIIKKI